MTFPILSAESATEFAARIGMFSVLLSSIEYFPQRHHLRDEGLISWEINSVRQAWCLHPGIAPVLNRLLNYPNVLGLLFFRAAFAGWLAFSPIPVIAQPWAVFMVTALTAAFITRSAYGQDGADQMAWVAGVALSLALAVGTPLALRAYLCFLAGQTIIAYSAAGFAKLVAAKWRDGSYLPAIFRITGYGHPGLARALEASPGLCRLLAAGLLVWECSFLLVLVCPPTAGLGFLICGVFFHVASAYFMGLNCFFWAFIATYPAIIFLVQHRPF